MNSHRLWKHRKDARREDRIEDATSGRVFVLPPRGYFGPPYAELEETLDEFGGPLATIWLPLGSHGEVGMTVNRHEAQAIVDALREAFPPAMSFVLEPNPDWPGIR